MDLRTDSHREHAHSYVVQDFADMDELTRLQLQDRMITQSMGGVLAEQSASLPFPRVLDVGCGTGAWLIELAKTAPLASYLLGVDLNEQVLRYALARAEAQQVQDRVHFRQMDVLRPLECSDRSFDLVNLRFGVSFLCTSDWPKLLREFFRVACIGGVARLTEMEMFIESSSLSLTRLLALSTAAFYQADRLFTPGSCGMTDHLALLLEQQGFQQVQTCAFVLEYRAGTQALQCFAQDMKSAFQTSLPFLQRWIQVPTDYEELCQQAYEDMQGPSFVATWTLLTAWGKRPANEERL